MNWLPLVGTGLGAVIALSGSLLASVRTGHDQLDRERETYRRQTYIGYATALDAAHAALRAVIRVPAAPGDRRAAARAAVDESGLFRNREQLLMFGSETVAAAGEAAFHALLGVRDVAVMDVDLVSEAYHDAYHVLARELWTLRMVVRGDVGERPFEPTQFGHADWSERQECALCQSRAQGF